ncbi:MAG: HAD-IB family hydrolase [Planctomycetes bacterium]|nr:HAD-IB family hydrolase [Planctomycetota bacterium]
MSRVAAIFDLDKTLVAGQSGVYAALKMWREKRVGIGIMFFAAYYLTLYKLGILDHVQMYRNAAKPFVGFTLDEVAKFSHELVRDKVLPRIYVDAARKVEEHRAREDVLVLLTSSSWFLAQYVGSALRIDHKLGSLPKFVDGKVADEGLDFIFGPGKLDAAKKLADKHGIDLSRSFFYTDSINDIHLLENVGEPRVVNPDPRLRRIAWQRGWNIERWTKTVGADHGLSCELALPPML